MSDRQDVTFTVNGEEHMIRVEPPNELVKPALMAPTSTNEASTAPFVLSRSRL